MTRGKLTGSAATDSGRKSLILVPVVARYPNYGGPTRLFENGCKGLENAGTIESYPSLTSEQVLSSVAIVGAVEELVCLTQRSQGLQVMSKAKGTIMGLKVIWAARKYAVFAFCGLLALVGCNGSNTSRSVSSSLFVAPIADESGAGRATTQLVNQFDFLQANSPEALAADLRDENVEANLLARLDDDEVLINDTRSNSVFSLNVGTGFEDPNCRQNPDDLDGDGEPECERVKMHFNRDGLAESLRAQQALISSEVDPIQLSNGWVLAFEVTTRSIVAFHKVPSRTVAVPGGGSVEVEYRSWKTSRNLNFGRGNGVLVAEVVTMNDLDEAVGSEAVARFYEIEPNKVLVFFNGVGAVHLLELEEVEEMRDFDLQIDDPEDRDVFPVSLLQGQIRLFPRSTFDGVVFDLPFLSFQQLGALTGDINLQLNGFAPVTIPTDGSALLFDSNSASFLRVLIRRGLDPATGETDAILGAAVTNAVLSSLLLLELQTLPGDQLRMNDAFFGPSGTEVLIMEEESNNVVAYDFTKPLSDNVRIFVDQSSIVSPRAQDGSNVGGIATGSEPELLFSTADVRDNRLTFDRGLDQLLSVSYLSSQLVIVLTRGDLISTTSEAVVDLTLVEPLSDLEVRAFDSASASLLNIRLDYRALPVDQSR